VRGRFRGWWPLVAVAPFLVAAFWLLYVVWRSPHRSDLATYGAFAAAVVTVMAGWIAWAWRARTRQIGPVVSGQHLDHVANLLAITVKSQWERAAGERGLAAEPIPVTWGRPSIPLAGPVGAAANSRRFDPLPGLTPVGEAQLAAGQIDDLHTLYGGLRSGRLVIAGPPGSGKSSAAVLLVLAALKHRDRVRAKDQPKVPVPVLFTAQDWDPRRQPVKEWLTKRLRQAYPLFAGQTGAANADGLIDAGKITVILDGLDEIAEELRPAALQALNQASFRVVVLSRTAEMASAASQRGVLQGAAAVELRVIDAATAAGYLERVQLDPPPHGWHDLIDRIRACPAGPLAEALNNPLALTLIRDTYQSGDDARELLDHCDAIQRRLSGTRAAEEITDHLLDRVLPAAYVPRPGQPAPHYDLKTAEKVLAKIASRMNQDGTRDLQWWHIPRWVPPVQRIVMGGLAVGLVFGLLVGLVIGSIYGLTDGLVALLLVGLLAGVAGGVAARGPGGLPTGIGSIGRPRFRQIFTGRSLRFGLLAGPAAGLVAGIAEGIAGNGIVTVIYFLAVGLIFGVFSIIAVGLANAFIDHDSTASPSPTTSWRNDRKYSVAIGLYVGLFVGLVAGLGFGLPIGLSQGTAIGLRTGILVGPVGFGFASGILAWISSTQAWFTTLAAAYLTIRWLTPLHLMNFLDDAHKRNVLRTVGPVYQFRHARLQDRLATVAANRRTDQPSG